MRTLKKTLSLVLAIVIVLGLCTIGATAAIEDTGYSDAANVTYEKAITILTKLNVIEGYKDGTFKPEASVTRAEAAAMIARMMVGGKEEAEKLPDAVDVTFSDVPATHWAAKYIEFCVTKGIIKGMGDGTFRPSENVTGTQLAAMLLRALGYGQMGEYEGAGWNMNAVADGLYYGVLADTKEDNFDDNATREETALYVFNTMFLDRVAYTDGTTGYKVQWDWRNSYPTFAWSAFNLFAGFAQVMENQETGAAYTVLSNFDLDDGYYYLDIETGLNMIAHEVRAYISWDFNEDHPNHVYYAECYYLEDVTTVLPTSVTYDDFYRAAVAVRKDLKNHYFSEFDMWYNYTYYGVPASDVQDYDYPNDSADYEVYYEKIGELKGQESSNDYVYTTYLLDYDGLPLAWLYTDWKVGQVKAIDTKHDEVEINVYQGYSNADGPVMKLDTYEMTFNGKSLVYDGIAKKDYVVLTQTGDLTHIAPTTTKTATITQRNTRNSSFNRGAFSKDPYGYGIPIEDADDLSEVNVGDSVKFYLSYDFGVMAYFFGLEILDKADLYGVVYLNYAARTATHGEWDDGTKDSPEKTTPVYKVQCITTEGKEVVYKVPEEQFNELVDGDGNTLEGVYNAYVNAKGYATFEIVGGDLEARKFNKEDGKNAYLKSGDEVYYVTDDTKVIYFTGKGDDLDITVAKRLSDRSDDEDYTVYAVYRGKTSPYKLQTVWAPEQKPLGDYADSYLYIFNASYYEFGAEDNWLAPSGYGDGKEVPYYYVYIDGKRTEIQLKPDGSDIFDGLWVKFGFYSYEVDDDGIYYLKPVEAANREIELTADTLRGAGRLYVDDCNGRLITTEIVDLSGDTTVDTRKNTNINDLDTLLEFIEDGYTVYVDYVYTAVSKDNVPTGVMYVVKVLWP